jgi:uncharacterized protein
MEKQRDITPDVLRGFALLGILVVNIQYMGLNSAEGARGEWTLGLANGSATFIIASIFAGKFYLLFSFLFGYSSNYVIKGDPANRARWIKRCMILIVFGALHFTFLWHGDILFVYGLFGLLLTAFFFRSDRTLKIWTRVIFLINAALVLLAGASLYLAERLFPEEFSQAPFEMELDQIMLDGTFWDAIPARLEVWGYSIVSGLFLQGPLAFIAFLVGLRMARSNFLASPIDTKQNKKMMKIGFIFGAPIQILAGIVLLQNEQSPAPSEAIYLNALFISFLAAPLLSMFYIGVIRKLVEEKPHLVSWMKPAGKMSLTIYISQSIIALIIFSSWGLGLFQQLQTWQVLFLSFGIWGLLVFLANHWLKKFNQGPLEALVGSLAKSR